MSDNWLRIIATDPNWVPGPTVSDTAVELLTGWLPEAEEVGAITTDEIEFIDSGVNLHAIRCPGCYADLPLDWWDAAVTRASESHFQDLITEMPCWLHQAVTQRPRVRLAGRLRPLRHRRAEPERRGRIKQADGGADPGPRSSPAADLAAPLSHGSGSARRHDDQIVTRGGVPSIPT